MICVLAMAIFASGWHIAYTMDSLTYRDAASHMLAGNPWQATNVFSASPSSIPLLQWPPLYPALWATASLLSNHNLDTAIPFLNWGLLAITSLLFYLGSLQANARPHIAACLTILHGSVLPVMVVFGSAWSETLFIPLVTAAYVMLTIYRRHPAQYIWLIGAALMVGAANWVRYAGVVFIPLLGLTLLSFTELSKQTRFRSLALAALTTLVSVSPLWLHNWLLTGMISGSARGGQISPQRIVSDWHTLIDLVAKSLFAFDTVLEALLTWPLLGLAVYVLVRLFRQRGALPLYDHKIWLPCLWGGAYLVFLFYARIVQQGIDFDLRMLAITVPFFFLASVPAVNASFGTSRIDAPKLLVLSLFSLTLWSAFCQTSETKENLASQGASSWPSTFSLVFHDLNRTSESSRQLEKTVTDSGTPQIILTDYRPLYLRYLTDIPAYAFTEVTVCKNWLQQYNNGVLLIQAPGNIALAKNCLTSNETWKLLTPNP